LTLGHPPRSLIAALAHVTLREDAGFHAYQMLEAGARQFAASGDMDQGRRILVAVARYLAAHSPTERAALQTADIARRLMRGGDLHQVERNREWRRDESDYHSVRFYGEPCAEAWRVRQGARTSVEQGQGANVEDRQFGREQHRAPSG
jgi:hypothetical protein